MIHTIQLIGFDGTQYWRLFFIQVVDGKEVYYGIVNRKHRLSFSRHGSGELHVDTGDGKRNMKDILPQLKSIALTELSHIEYLGTFTAPIKQEEISDEEYKKYFSKKYSGIFIIDLRNYTGTINIQPAIIPENARQDVFKNMPPHKPQVYVYTASNPWIVFYILDVPTKEKIIPEQGVEKKENLPRPESIRSSI